ncbi:MAG: polyphosphate kinase 2 [Anaerolineae bacterium]|nr:polyphosphate kinase 2 [Anaerolineae bacterium]
MEDSDLDQAPDAVILAARSDGDRADGHPVVDVEGDLAVEQSAGKKLHKKHKKAKKPHAEHTDGAGKPDSAGDVDKEKKKKKGPLSARKFARFYLKELRRLQFELVKLQYWIQAKGLRVVLLFEGRDAAGKGGVIQRIVEPMNPRGIRQVALGKPSDRERTQWYFQRYVEHLPSAGEIVIFDRSWYNRAGVERVMGFCTDHEYWEFMRSCPEFERMLVRSGIILLKYYLSVSDAEQERRFQSRAKDPRRRWKLSPMDLETRLRWVEYSKAKDLMLEYTDIPESRWYQVESNNKELARLTVIEHILSMIPYEDIIPKALELPPRPAPDVHYVRPPRQRHLFLTSPYAQRAPEQ